MKKLNECQRKVHLSTISIINCGGCVHKVTLTVPSTINLTQRDQSTQQPISQSIPHTHIYSLQMPCFSVWRERRCQCSVHLSLITADMLAVQCQKHLFSTRKKINLYAQLCRAWWLIVIAVHLIRSEFPALPGRRAAESPGDYCHVLLICGHFPHCLRSTNLIGCATVRIWRHLTAGSDNWLFGSDPWHIDVHVTVLLCSP